MKRALRCVKRPIKKTCFSTWHNLFWKTSVSFSKPIIHERYHAATHLDGHHWGTSKPKRGESKQTTEALLRPPTSFLAIVCHRAGMTEWTGTGYSSCQILNIHCLSCVDEIACSCCHDCSSSQMKAFQAALTVVNRCNRLGKMLSYF